MSQTNPSTSSQSVETKLQSELPNTFITSEDLENSEISGNNHNNHHLIDTKQTDSNQLERDFAPVKLLTIAILTLGIGFWGGQWWQATQIKSGKDTPKAEAGPRNRSILVEISPVKMAMIQDTTEFVGTLQAEKVVDVRSESDGRVMEILVNAGDRLTSGQAIARLKVDDIEADWRRAQANLAQSRSRLAQLRAGSRPEEIAAARARLNQEEANLARLQAGYRPEEITAAQARLNQAKANLAKLRTGNRPEEIAVAEAQLRKAEASLADAQTGSYIEEIAQAKSLIAVSQAELDLARQQVQRNESLRDEGAIADLTFEELQKEERSARARVEAAQGRLKQLEQNRLSDIKEKQADVEESRQDLQRIASGFRREEVDLAQAQVMEAESKLRDLQSGSRPEDIAQAEANVAEANSQLQELLNGTRQEEIDQAEAEVAAAIANVQSYQVQLQDKVITAPFAGVMGDVLVKTGDYVKNGDVIGKLTQNQALELRLPVPLEKKAQLRMGLPVRILTSDGKPLTTGQISFIAPSVNDSQTILAKASVNNNQGQLKDGQFVKAEIIWSQKQSVVVPMTAVRFQGEQKIVFLAEGSGENMQAKEQEIKLGLIQGEQAEVLENLTVGQKLITSGLQRLKDGARIMDKSLAKPPGTDQPGKSGKP